MKTAKKFRLPGADWKVPYHELSFFGRFVRVLGLTGRFFVRDKISRDATALTYYTLFSIIPFAALSFGIAKGFDLDTLLRQTLEQHFSQHRETLDWIYRFSDSTLEQARGGIVAGIGVVFLFLTVILLASNVEGVFNRIWQLPPRKNVVGKIGDYLAVLLITPILLVLLGGSSVAAHSFINHLTNLFPGPIPGSVRITEIICNCIPYLVSWGIFAAMYACLPNTRVSTVPALTAGILVGTIFQALQSSLLILQIGLSRYNAIYGSFALVPLLLMWMQWSWKIILFGAELAFVLQYAGSGRFEVADLHISDRERKQYILETIRRIALRFERGQGATTIGELCAEMGVAAFLVRQFLNDLEAAGLIKPVGHDKNDTYLPALPPSQLTPVHVLAKLNDIGDDHLRPEDESALEPVRTLCDRLEQAMAADAANRPLVQVEEAAQEQA